MVNDTELQKMIDTVNRKARDETTKVWNRRIFQTAGLRRKNHTLTVAEFKQIFKGKLDYGVKMLEEMSKEDYIESINKKYKDSIVLMLQRMGLEYDAKQVENMGMSKFTELQQQNKWDYVYEKYSSYAEDLDANAISPSATLVKDAERLAQNMSRRMSRLLGY